MKVGDPWLLWATNDNQKYFLKLKVQKHQKLHTRRQMMRNPGGNQG